MGLRFRKSISFGGGLKLNISKSGFGFSGGVRGARFGLGPKGPYAGVGIPGTGISYFKYLGSGSKKRQPIHKYKSVPLENTSRAMESKNYEAQNNPMPKSATNVLPQAPKKLCFYCKKELTSDELWRGICFSCHNICG